MKRTPLKRSGLPARRTPIKAKRSKPRRTTVLRDREYLDWLTCAVCEACVAQSAVSDMKPGWSRVWCDPAHGPSSGTGVKGPDSGAIPLCREHHTEQHQIGWKAFQSKWKLSRAKIARELYSSYLIEKWSTQ
jgi:hypothetical protein